MTQTSYAVDLIDKNINYPFNTVNSFVDKLEVFFSTHHIVEKDMKKVYENIFILQKKAEKNTLEAELYQLTLIYMKHNINGFYPGLHGVKLQKKILVTNGKKELPPFDDFNYCLEGQPILVVPKEMSLIEVKEKFLYNPGYLSLFRPETQDTIGGLQDITFYNHSQLLGGYSSVELYCKLNNSYFYQFIDEINFYLTPKISHEYRMSLIEKNEKLWEKMKQLSLKLGILITTLSSNDSMEPQELHSSWYNDGVLSIYRAHNISYDAIFMSYLIYKDDDFILYEMPLIKTSNGELLPSDPVLKDLPIECDEQNRSNLTDEQRGRNPKVCNEAVLKLVQNSMQSGSKKTLIEKRVQRFLDIIKK